VASPIVSSTDISRPPDEVFAYVTDPHHFGEWQEGVVEGHLEGGDVPHVGSICKTTRRLGGANRITTSELTVLEPPRRWAVHGTEGPIRADVDVTVAPLAEDRGSRVTIRLDFHGHGVGLLIAPMVVRQARKEVPRSLGRLRQLLEA
jgi:carbon monoxide dehydrogenase subunit G